MPTTANPLCATSLFATQPLNTITTTRYRHDASSLGTLRPNKNGSRQAPSYGFKPVEKNSKRKANSSGEKPGSLQGISTLSNVNSKTHMPSAGFEPVHERYLRAREVKRTFWSGLTT